MSVFCDLTTRLVCILIAFSSLHAHATISITDISGASFFTGLASNDEEGDSEVIYGGTAGDACTDGGSNESTCSNCTASHGTDFTSSCNDTRIYSSLKLKIKFSSDNTAGVAVMTNSDGTTNVTSASDSTGNLSSGSTHTLSVEWTNICQTLLAIDSACETDGTASVKVGVSKDGSNNTLSDSDDDSTTIQITVKRDITGVGKTCSDATLAAEDGICGFEMFPGDQKVFIKTLTAASGFPTAGSSISYNKIRVYFAETSTFTDITHSSSFGTFEVEKNDDNSIETDTDSIDGLTNGSTYSFLVASVDQAGNVGQHFPPASGDSSIHTMIPSPVSALLTEDLQCFIATAAFGHPFKNQVKTLRDFRDQVLSESALGRMMIDAYYFVSPKLADYIAKRPWARKAVRHALLPAILLAQATLDWGILPTLSIILLGLSALAITILFAARRVRTNATA